MEELDSLAGLFINLIRAGAVARVAHCFLKMIGNEDEYGLYKKRIENVVKFVILAESVWILKDLAIHYFG